MVKTNDVPVGEIALDYYKLFTLKISEGCVQNCK
jgi:hypothetical protein